MQRLVHVSDIHFGCQNARAVEAARDLICENPPDLLVVTGDVTQSGRQTEFAAAAAWLEQLPQPRICTPGNHDTPYFNLIDRIFHPFARYGQHLGPLADGYSNGELAVQAINTSRGAQVRLNWSKGAIRLRDAEQACGALARTPDALRVALCHHPLMEVTGGPMTGRVIGGRLASEILTAGGVDLILTGHVHMPFAHALPFGDEKTYAVGAGTLSLRERAAPAGFNVIETNESSILVTALGWTGSRFQPVRSWGFERRRPN